MNILTRKEREENLLKAYSFKTKKRQKPKSELTIAREREMRDSLVLSNNISSVLSRQMNQIGKSIRSRFRETFAGFGINLGGERDATELIQKYVPSFHFSGILEILKVSTKMFMRAYMRQDMEALLSYLHIFPLHPQLLAKLQAEKKHNESKGIERMYRAVKADWLFAGGEANEETGSASLVFMRRGRYIYYERITETSELVSGSREEREGSFMIIIGLINAKESEEVPKVYILSMGFRFNDEIEREKEKEKEKEKEDEEEEK